MLSGRKEVENQSQLGQIVDMPFEVFKQEIVKHKVNVGTINNLVLMLESAYHELKCRKDVLIDLAVTNQKTKEEVKRPLEGLYAEMTKLEQKIVYLKGLSKRFLDEVNTTS